MDGYSILSYACNVGKPAVLATLVHVEGHSYRKAGASMLLLPDGIKIGSLSPGCLESDLQERVGDILHTGEAEHVVYNMRPEEDAVWGEAIGCGGVLRILLEPMQGCPLEWLAEACSEVEAGAEVELVRYLIGRKIHYEIKSSRVNRSNPIASSLAKEKRTALFSTTFAPRPRLFVFGADDGTVPIARLAGGIGFRVAVGDWRSSLCYPERFPDAELAIGSPESICASLAITADDYILICGHQLHKDREMLERVLPLKPVYLGVMGSKNRIRHLFEGLQDTKDIYAPVGIDIGAEGPEEIAISITAQLIAVRKDRQRRQGVGSFAYRWDLLGGGTEQENGNSQAFLGACTR
ncbi:XdhC family protein [Cohnella silvisoli]|uniref:XdhC family protein n=1 Tax=Cohnella silvisoli TaxID=2873699 RepID=A0ABV1KUY6_9BACL|nr:XdhC family protein [Cohnella silvisoli]MCD9023316.1 XdhC family protein [Cohnella silvisoli]